ncbi:MAG: hypothetical protein OFPI_22420 [Osedax symbiont Rs2]|nr:MAG: hypothetical protein OFPI_22420 [Osedax symbiont Rs2]
MYLLIRTAATSGLSYCIEIHLKLKKKDAAVAKKRDAN